MNRSFFFLWLNDTTHERYYWSQAAQNFTTKFADATKFGSRAEAEAEAEYADRHTKAEVIVQEMLVDERSKERSAA